MGTRITAYRHRGVRAGVEAGVRVRDLFRPLRFVLSL